MRLFKAVLFRLIAVGIATTVSLIAAELVLRLSAASQYVYQDPVLFSDPVTYVPNQVGYHQLAREFNIQIKINSRGFRDTEYTPAPEARTIVTLGDSFTEGFGVDAEAVWSKRLQERVVRDRLAYEHVYNAGHSGTNPKNYRAVYEHFFKNDPHVQLVVIGFCLANDIVEESTPVNLRPQRAPKKGLNYVLSKYSIIYNLARSRLRYDRRLERVMAKFGLTNPPIITTDLLNNEENRRRWPYAVQFLTDFAREINADGKKVLIVFIPSKELVLDDYFDTLLKVTETPPASIDRYGFRDYALDRFQRAQVPVLDLTPALRAQRTADLYFVGDGHWNPAGHQFAADTIYEYLSRHGLL
ncbi:MAG TPA: SGNH/GDSL hydrolase family protein [Vicinamibacterales bacterium]